MITIAAEHTPTGEPARYVIAARVIAVSRTGGHYYLLVYHEPLPGVFGVYKVDNISESKALLIASDRKELAGVRHNTLMAFYERLHDLNV